MGKDPDSEWTRDAKQEKAEAWAKIQMEIEDAQRAAYEASRDFREDET